MVVVTAPRQEWHGCTPCAADPPSARSTSVSLDPTGPTYAERATEPGAIASTSSHSRRGLNRLARKLGVKTGLIVPETWRSAPAPGSVAQHHPHGRAMGQRRSSSVGQCGGLTCAHRSRYPSRCSHPRPPPRLRPCPVSRLWTPCHRAHRRQQRPSASVRRTARGEQMTALPPPRRLTSLAIRPAARRRRTG